jgi:hypothetical protein
VCGAWGSTCTADETPEIRAPEIVDQRAPWTQWRHRSVREVRRRLPDGRRIVVWPKGAPIPPEEALRQGVARWEDLTADEQRRVVERLTQRGKDAAAIIQTSRGLAR